MIRKLKVIAHIYTDFEEKFGIPRQSGLVKGLRGRIVFEEAYRSAEAVRGLEGFDYIWLLWQFQGVDEDRWSPMVKPPRLGGKTRMGVFATRSPFRPNPLGLSCVRLEGVEWDTPEGPVLHVSGADLVDGTPILDVKPYIPYADCHPEAAGGFAGSAPERALAVECPPGLLSQVPEGRRAALLGVLGQDPRPSYQDDPGRVYGFGFAGLEVRFTVREGVLTVTDIGPSGP